MYVRIWRRRFYPDRIVRSVVINDRCEVLPGTLNGDSSVCPLAIGGAGSGRRRTGRRRPPGADFSASQLPKGDLPRSVLLDQLLDDGVLSRYWPMRRSVVSTVCSMRSTSAAGVSRLCRRRFNQGDACNTHLIGMHSLWCKLLPATFGRQSSKMSNDFSIECA